MPRNEDLIGQVFSRLTVFSKLTERDKHGHVQWECACRCGTIVIVRAGSLKSGATRSCGCLQKEATSKAVTGMVREANITHGLSNSPEYKVWVGIKERCYSESFRDFPYYGGRGITMSDEWKDDFEAFYRDMGPRPTASHSVERGNNNLGYSKENCRWATKLEQANNRRNNLLCEYHEERKTLAEWCRELSLNYGKAYYLLSKGVAFQDAANLLTSEEYNKK